MVNTTIGSNSCPGSRDSSLIRRMNAWKSSHSRESSREESISGQEDSPAEDSSLSPDPDSSQDSGSRQLGNSDTVSDYLQLKNTLVGSSLRNGRLSRSKLNTDNNNHHHHHDLNNHLNMSTNLTTLPPHPSHHTNGTSISVSSTGSNTTTSVAKTINTINSAGNGVLCKPPIPDTGADPNRILLNHWSEYIHLNGRKYYYNSVTKQSSWKPPRRDLPSVSLMPKTEM